MKLAALLLLFTGVVFAQCGPPSYSCAYTGTDPITTPQAPFTQATPANTVVQDSGLVHLRLLRLTDPSTGCPTVKAVETTWSGGSNEIMFNTNSTLIAVKCTGGVTHVIGFNPYSFQGWTTGVSPTSCTGANGFSRSKPNRWFCMPQGGTKVFAKDFLEAGGNPCGHGTGTCPDPTVPAVQTELLDFANCPGALLTAPRWNGILGIGEADTPLVAAFSWTGGQNTGHLVFRYPPGGACQTLDTTSGTLINGFTGNTLQASGPVHDSYTNGFYVQVSLESCTGPDCGAYQGPWIWKLGTTKVWPLAQKQFAGGHNSLGHNFFFNTSNPSVWRWPLSAFVGVQIGKMTPPCCSDNHIEADIKVDANPVLGTSSGVNGEVFGLATDGSGTLYRFCKTYSSGSTATNFWGQYAIGAASQDRLFFAFTSDMQGQLGVYVDGGKTLNRTDVFLCSL